MPENILREFLRETAGRLENLCADLPPDGQPISEETLRAVFRLTHTVKGNSQVFGLKNLARFSAQFENLLQALNTGELKQTAETSALFKAGLNQLRINCDNPDFKFDEIPILQINSADEKPAAEEHLTEKIPPEFLNLLSDDEKKSLKHAFRRGKNFYAVEVRFELANFGEDFKLLRNSPQKYGEVIAVLPARNSPRKEQINFCFLFAANSAPQKLIKDFDAKIVFAIDSEIENRADDLDEILRNIIADCKKRAEKAGKKIIFEISRNAAKPSAENLSLIRDAAIHLLRNAVDHAIETPAERIAAGKMPHSTIKINTALADGSIFLEIADDGRGIDSEKISIRAKRNGAIPQEKTLTHKEAAELIFTTGFSTAETVSETSGRGIGLDSVKDSVENAGGQIRVVTADTPGAIFEIRLPQN